MTPTSRSTIQWRAGLDRARHLDTAVLPRPQSSCCRWHWRRSRQRRARSPLCHAQCDRLAQSAWAL